MDGDGLTRREVLQAGLGMLAGAAVPTLPGRSAALESGEVARQAATAQQPNVVYILSDQLRACSVGCYQNTEVSTPHIDALAGQGVLFTNAVSTTPWCSPHRACLMTGRYPTVTGVVTNNIKLPQAEECLAEVFRANGYVTQYIGNRHLNGETPEPLVDPGWVRPQARQGYPRWTAYNYSHVYYQSRYYLNSNPAIRTIPAGRYEPDWQTDRAMQFMSGNAARAFSLFLSIGTPHPAVWGGGPFLPPGGDYHFPYDPASLTPRLNVDFPYPDTVREKYAGYYGMISNIDYNVGRIVDKLDSLGLTGSTIVVVSSDHGDVLGSHCGELGYLSGKGAIYAESHNVPLILRYPAQVAPAVVPDLFASVDIMPTLLGLCGLPVPSGVMGRDFSPVLTGGGDPIEPPWGPVPSADSALAGMFNGEWVGVCTQEHSLRCDCGTLIPSHLFDNTLDPYKMANVVDDPSYQAIKDLLYADLLAWLDYVQPKGG